MMSYTPTLKEYYIETIRPSLKDEFDYTSPMEVPYIEKICLNQGIGRATQDKKLIEKSQRQLSLIAGQKAVPRKAKYSISNFNLREGQTVGMRVTLRQNRMYEFLDRLINVALPRVRDFRGISEKSFDGHGNYTLGIKEQIIFPEIDLDEVDEIMGMDINFVTTAATDEESLALLREMGMPFKNQNN